MTTVGATFTNRLTLANTSKQEQEVVLFAQLPPSVQLLSPMPERVRLIPNEVIMVPIKGLVNRQAGVPVDQIIIHVRDIAGETLVIKRFSLIVKGKTQASVSLYIPDETAVLLSNTDAAHLRLRLVHNRLTPASYMISAASLPEAASPVSILVNLRAGQDTTITVLVNPLHKWSINEPYQLSLTVHDESQTIVGSVVYKLVVAVAAKRYTESAWTAQGGGHGASMALTRFSTNQWAKETRVWGTDSVGKAKVGFQLHYLNYGSGSVQQMQNSFISVEMALTTVRLGSLYDFHELPLFGRGLKVNVDDNKGQWTFWAVNTHQNWLYNDRNAWSGNVYSVQYDRESARLPGGRWSFSTSHFTQPATQRIGYLNFARFHYVRNEHHDLQVLGGQSVEFARGGQARTFGLTAQLDYRYQRSKLNYQVRSILSSPSYAGIQRGAALVFGNLFWRLTPHTSITTRLNHLAYNRLMFTSPVEFRRDKFSNTLAEVGVSQQLGGFALGLRPYWFNQQDVSNPFSTQANAYRIVPSVAFRRRRFGQIDASYDAGLVKYQTPDGTLSQSVSQRIFTSLSIGPLNFWGYWQKGPYFLFDLRNASPEKIMTSSLTPTIDFALLNRRIIGSLGFNYLRDSFTGDARYTAVGRIVADVSPTLSIQLMGNGTPYSQDPQFAYSQYRMEVIKRFTGLKAQRHGTLRLSFFDDANGNGQKEPNENWVDSLRVTINDNTLLTNTRGSITYRNLPPGTYAISAISVSRVGDPILYHEKLVITQSLTKLVPLIRTYRVSGRLRCQPNGYDAKPCDFSRFTLEVYEGERKGTSGSPLPDGTFSLHLIPGNYTMLVRDYGRQVQATVKTIPFTLTKQGEHPVFDWTVDGSTRAVEIKRFSSKQ